MFERYEQKSNLLTDGHRVGHFPSVSVALPGLISHRLLSVCVSLCVCVRVCVCVHVNVHTCVCAKLSHDCQSSDCVLVMRAGLGEGLTGGCEGKLIRL